MTDFSMAPVAQALAPFAVAAGTAILGIGVKWFGDQVKRWTGHAMAQADQDKLQKAVDDAAGVIFAGAEAGFSSLSVKVSDPKIAAAVNTVEMLAPGVAANIGLTPDAVAHKIAGAVGRLQSNSTTTATPTLAKAS